MKHIPKPQWSKQWEVTAGRDGLEEQRRGSPAQPPLRALGPDRGFHRPMVMGGLCGVGLGKTVGEKKSS